MKRFTTILTLLTLVSLFSVAYAGDRSSCKASASVCAGGAGALTTASADKDATTFMINMGECCTAAAAAGKGCGDMDAAAVEAKFAAYTAQNAALAEMQACCATAVASDKGCCGMDAIALKAKYDGAVADAKAKQVSAAGCAASCGAAAAATCGSKTNEVATTSEK